MSARLIIGGWDSRCGECGKSANPSEQGHFTQLGYGPNNGQPGCGVIWTTKESSYGMVLTMRPDLPQIGFIIGAADRSHPDPKR